MFVLLAQGGENNPVLWALGLVGILALVIGGGIAWFMRGGKVKPVELEDDKKRRHDR